MNPSRLWVAISTSPTLMRRVNGWFTIFWIVMIPVSLATGWISSVTYVAVLSLWALVSGHWAAWQAARVEVHQDEDADVQEVLDELRTVVAELRSDGDTPRPRTVTPKLAPTASTAKAAVTP